MEVTNQSEDWNKPTQPQQDNKKVLAGVMGILFGGLGVHKFILGCVEIHFYLYIFYEIVVFFLATNCTNFHKFILGCIEIHPYRNIIPTGFCFGEWFWFCVCCSDLVFFVFTYRTVFVLSAVLFY